MKYRILSLAALVACATPTDANRQEVPSVDFRIVHPAIVRVTVTPANGNAYPAGKVQYVAEARDGQGRLLKASAWKWSSSDTTIAVVSSTGLATARAVGTGVIKAVAYPPWRRR